MLYDLSVQVEPPHRRPTAMRRAAGPPTMGARLNARPDWPAPSLKLL